MREVAELQTFAKNAGWGLLVILGWLGIMALYFTVYGLIEQDAVPISLGTRTFEVEQWDAGYFSAKGSYQNDNAVEDGDELPLQTEAVSCVKATNTCTIASADVYDHYLNVDLSSYDITAWTDKQITFGDDSAICATSTFIIDRTAQSMTLLARKKAIIPAYALNSPLHPCDKLKDKNISLANGFKVYWARRQAFELRNGLYFHIALAAMNLAYVGLIVWLWRRLSRSPAVAAGL